MANRLGIDFFDIPCYNLALSLLGKVLVRKLKNGTKLKARIIETECYPGGEDKASHSYNGRRTVRNEPMYMDAGTTYVYMTYGMYHCINISSTEPGGAVLLRALEPLEGVEHMNELRRASRKSKKRDKSANENLQDIPSKLLANGPAKLCMAFDITKEEFNKINLGLSDRLWVEDDPTFDYNFKVVKTSRIGIDSVEKEWAKKPLRFYIFGNVFVSKRDLKSEREIT